MRRNVGLVVPVHLSLANVVIAVLLDSLNELYLSVYTLLLYEISIAVRASYSLM